MWRPPGLSTNATATIAEGQNETSFVITAAENAELRSWKVCVMGESDPVTGLLRNASSLVDLPVEENYLKMTMNLGTVVQNGEGEILIDIEGIRDFQGEAAVKVVGMPAKTTFTEVKVKPGLEQLRIPVKAEADAPVGQHKNLFCEMVLTANGKQVMQRTGRGGILRVDPKPKETPAPAAVAQNQPAKPAAPAPAAAKPLSRLEQLRLEAQKQAEAAKK
jgi:hypothetical protein